MEEDSITTEFTIIIEGKFDSNKWSENEIEKKFKERINNLFYGRLLDYFIDDITVTTKFKE